MNKIAAWLLAAVAFQAAGQAPRPAFLLGAAQSTIRSRFGAPSSYFSNGVHYPAYPFRTMSLVWDVYRFHGGGQVYEAMLHFKIDPNGSRLHPSLVLEEVRFEFDKPLPARAALKAIPEVARQCAGGCAVITKKRVSFETLTILPDHPAEHQAAFELYWDSADNITSRPVLSLGDPITWVSMSGRELEDEYPEPTSRTVGHWPE